MIKKSLTNLLHKKKYEPKKSDYILYKIVDIENNDCVTIQCINTSGIFYSKIVDVVCDTDILYGLHPIQSCFIGIQYINIIRGYNDNISQKNYQANQQDHILNRRYGRYQINSQDMSGNIGFVDILSKQYFVMDIDSIVQSNSLIEEFDSSQSFYIGCSYGAHIQKSIHTKSNYKKIRKPDLRLVK